MGWKLDVFANYLDAATLQAIASHELVEEEDVVDEIFWNGTHQVDSLLGLL